MEKKILDSIHYSDLIKNIFDFINIKRKLHIIKYNKKYQKKLNITLDDYKYFNSVIILKSTENENFLLDKKAAKKSQLLKNCLEDDEDFKELNLIDVKSKYLNLIVEFLEHYKDSEPKLPPKPLKDGNVMQYFDDWSKIFFSKLNLEDVIGLSNASNYMDIDCLLIICCSLIAAEMIDKPVEEVQKTFGIENSFTEEEMLEYDNYPIG